MIITRIHRSDLIINSKATAQEFYKGVKSCILIPYIEDMMIRIEPDNLIGFVSKEAIKNGIAPFIPNIHDKDGSIAYQHRKHINAYLRKDEA